MDRLNSISYSYHYKNIDSTLHYAKTAFNRSEGYDDGKAEALNNIAFANIAKMNYSDAGKKLDSIEVLTDNQVELAISYIQQMRLCQRESRNKDFYDYQEKATKSLKRINESRDMLDERQRNRMVYAESELAIVTSTYYYYIGLESRSTEAILSIDANGEIQKDSAQLMNYLYQVGAGGIVNEGTHDDINQKEWEYLVRCYMLAIQSGSIYWEANSLQTMSEHLLDKKVRDKLIASNRQSIRYINTDNMPDSLLAGYLAQKSLMLFQSLGDVYQTAGSYRTLASCYWDVGDYRSAMICLEDALNKDMRIEQAPDLVASIREQLSIVYSAMNQKPNSDYNRNIYLDLQDMTRQDRHLEARAEQLKRSSNQLNLMISAVLVMIVVVVTLMFLFYNLHKKKQKNTPINDLLKPLEQWRQDNMQFSNELDEKHEEINENYAINVIHIANNKKRNLENRAKIFLVNSIMPLIDRIIHEVGRLKKEKESSNVRAERYGYVAELTDKINDYNNVLTQWIQLRQGELSMHIESFPLEDIFSVVKKSRMSFQLKGINLVVEPTTFSVKADRVLTLFMLNTLADNARKFTPKGGIVTIFSQSTDNYVEVSVTDTGSGMSADELSGIFDHKIYNGHGFGLMNCKGIIEKYRKISQIFSVCKLSAESKEGSGSRFFFRLPHGVVRVMIALLSLLSSYSVSARNETPQKLAENYSDSAYFSNVGGNYKKTLQFADSVLKYLNIAYRQVSNNGNVLMVKSGNLKTEPAEVTWFHDGIDIDYGVILDIRNESAVAALAIHDWDLYRYNNRAFTLLFKEKSADKKLEEYCRMMQTSETNKMIAVALLIVLFIIILVAYYFLYYRQHINYDYYIEQVGHINDILLSKRTDEEKLSLIIPISTDKYPEALKIIVDKVKEALASSVENSKKKEYEIELAEDESRRAEFESDKLHVSNNVLDNCLSTLKHETMYYPSRIRQIVEEVNAGNTAEEPTKLQAIDELVSYYKELYSILSAQAMKQVDVVNNKCLPVGLEKILNTDNRGYFVMGDEMMLKHLFDILLKQNNGSFADVRISEKEEKYIVIELEMNRLAFRELFTPSMENIPFMICRQIVRENSESTNLRGCGIVAKPSAGNGTLITIMLASAKVDTSKNK
ncbi:MAG: DUF5112 domain-containing protein [Prevotella sp.]|uniref:sensor histidine kinase n=1 Tax=Prevotella sp. TaxID=59823 RepID=UPI002A270B0E|nr:DUF5112 domain-containing protein [Prevotella sp.]MDD7318142.1 DUF5112 domain-containing protein [Prevotellaceae bacterium]MDY4020969.1 DUF5112 domain-containing protein [Prevotella sp.]